MARVAGLGLVVARVADRAVAELGPGALGSARHGPAGPMATARSGLDPAKLLRSDLRVQALGLEVGRVVGH